MKASSYLHPIGLATWMFSTQFPIDRPLGINLVPRGFFFCIFFFCTFLSCAEDTGEKGDE